MTIFGGETGSGRTVLVVDDDPSVLAFVQTILELDEYRVLATGSPREALALAADEAVGVDVLIADVEMGRRDFPDLVPAVLTLHPKARVLFASGSGGQATAGDAFIPKPFTARGLLEKVRRLNP